MSETRTTPRPSEPTATAVDEELAGAVAEVARVMGTPVATLFLYDRQRDQLVLAATQGLGRAGIGFITVSPGEGVSGVAAMSRRPVRIRDVEDDDVFAVIPGFDQSDFRSMLAVPVHRGPVVVGVLNVQTAAPHDYDDGEVAALQEQADRLAELLSRGRADPWNRLSLRGPELLATLRGMVNASRGPQRVCEDIVDELVLVLAGTDVVVVLAEDDGDGVPRTTTIGAQDSPSLRDAAERFAREGRRPVSEDVLLLALGDAGSPCGVLGLVNTSSGAPAWAPAPVRAYVDSVVDHLGTAVDRMLRRAHRLRVDARAGSFGEERTPYRELVSYVLDDRGLEPLVAHARDILGTPLAVVDGFGLVLAGQQPSAVVTDVPVSAAEPQLGRLLAGRDLTDHPWLEALTHVVALELAKWRAAFEVERRLRGDVLDLLMDADGVDRPDAARRASLAGIDLSAAYRPVAVEVVLTGAGPGPVDPLESGDGARGVVAMAHRCFGQPPEAVVLLRDTGVLVLLQASVEDVAERAATFARRLERSGRVEATGTGIGRPATWGPSFAAGVRRTTTTAGLARTLGGGEPLTDDRLGVHGLLLELDETARRDFVGEQLGAVLEADSRGAGEFVRTLEAYHRLGERLKPTADALFIHVNTLKYRLAKIDAATAGRFSSPTRRFEMYLALYLLRLMEPQRPSLLGD